ncbi:MAG: hypothetical protein MUO35_13800 [Anaerolineales bacterium]|nr:hypothetical protein [Anaerolineales bacterium]
MATTEPTAPLPETAPDPIGGTPPAATPVPAEATPPSPAPTVDWENRYKAAQAELTRQQMARAQAERERDALKFDRPEPDDDSDAPTPARPAKRNSEAAVEWQKRALAAEWQNARSVFGEEIVDTYAVSAGLLGSASTPADYVNAFEVYHQARSKGMTHQQAVAEAAPPPPAPVVDSNRSDGPLLAEVDQKLREAAAANDLRGWLKAKLSAG